MVIRYPDIVVNLTGEDGRAESDGNAFGIIAAVMRALRRDVSNDAAVEFQNQAFNCGSYDELLQLVMITITVA